MPDHSRCCGLEWTAARLSRADQVWSKHIGSGHGSWIATMTTVLDEASSGERREIPRDWDALRAKLAALPSEPMRECVRST
jgi:hypothetical protein